tara:strand:+ start:1187 stop:1570 length:384 start_codon:yes stop_codon:yes gene_type:complete
MVDAIQLALKADGFKELQSKRLSLAKEVKELKEKEDLFKDELINTLKANPELKGIVGNLCKITLKDPTERPIVKDWDAFYQYIYNNKAWDLLQRRVGERAVIDRWLEGEVIPGIESIEVQNLSITKP